MVVPEDHVLFFEDTENLVRLVTVARMNLLRAIREKAGSITEISTRLHRDRRAVKRDLDVLASVGLVCFEEIPLPGHGRQKEVRASTEQVLLAL